jgi:hypothetical protein
MRILTDSAFFISNLTRQYLCFASCPRAAKSVFVTFVACLVPKALRDVPVYVLDAFVGPRLSSRLMSSAGQRQRNDRPPAEADRSLVKEVCARSAAPLIAAADLQTGASSGQGRAERLQLGRPR